MVRAVWATMSTAGIEIPCMLNRCSGSEWRTVDPRVFCTEVELGLHSLKRSLEQSQEHQGSYCKDENE